VNRVPIDLDELVSFLDQPRRGPVRAFLDRTTGQLEPMPRDAEVEGVFDDVLAAPHRWIEVHPLPLAHRVELRRRFLEEVNDPLARAHLSESLAQPRSFARFDAVLRIHAGLLDQWLGFRTRALAAVAHAWLSAIGVEAMGNATARSIS
jgi:uncharacterized protein UPF0158